jgi:hypothetical protein
VTHPHPSVHQERGSIEYLGRQANRDEEEDWAVSNGGSRPPGV